MSTSTRLDLWLVAQDWTVPVTLSDLSSLTPSQLAVTSLRTDLDPLLTKRAYHEFLCQRKEYIHSDREVQMLLFDIPLGLPLPATLDFALLSPTNLILLQFKPACTGDLARQAGDLFLSLSLTARGSAEQNKASWAVKVEKYRVERPGGAAEDEGELWLVVEEEGLRAMKGEELVGEVRAQDVAKYIYINGASDPDLAAVDTALLLSLADWTTTVTIHLGMAEREDRAFKAARKAISRWSKKWGSEVEVKRRVPFLVVSPIASDAALKYSSLELLQREPLCWPSPPLPSHASPPPSQTVFSPSPPPIAPHSSAPTPHLSDSTMKYSSAPPLLPPEEGLNESIWALVGDEPQAVEWQPGFYARQFAFIEAIDPSTTSLRHVPSFSDEEIALLSVKPRFSALPPTPTTQTLEGKHYGNHKAEERLAMERIYRSVGYERLSLNQTRHLLLSPSPSLLPLQTYAKLVAKIISARDAVEEAYFSVLQTGLYPRRRLRDNNDPVEWLILIVEGLSADTDHYRRDWFAEAPFGHFNTLITHCKFNTRQIGGGPFHRFKDKLAKIVEYEERMCERFGGRRGGDG
ncbi:hypothetical protein JCM11251_005292 [Rhodosporidiobolus azoricus]